MLNKDKLKQIFGYYGELNQILKLQEEARELDDSVEDVIVIDGEIGSLSVRASSDKDDFIEELADVYVLISQFLMQPIYKEKILKIANMKIDRQLKRIKKEKANE
jgi:NTP pyrophosphatase (non-canonical NTP hydrolase)